MRAVVVGSTNVDLVLSVAALPRPGETVLSSASRREAGGKGANQAVALARLGAAVRLVSAVGDDEDGRWSCEQLLAEGVDTSLVRVVPVPTGTAVVVVERDAENLIVVAPGANAHVISPEVLSADVVLLSLEVPLPAVLDTARLATCPVVLNAAPARVLPPELLAEVDVLIVNEHELNMVGTAHDLVVVTRGSQGCRAIHAGISRDWDASPAEVVDTTGAGDCFSAALAFGVGSGWPLERSIALALRAAARAVSRPGARGGLPRMAELEAQ